MDVMSLIKPARALVFGDFMVDVYIQGSVQRISPEAPVPVLSVESESYRPGGAGNAILNLLSLGMQVRACGRVGDDESGRCFIKELSREECIDLEGVIVDKLFQTPVKKRLIADNQQLLRVDYENPSPMGSAMEERILMKLPALMKDVDVVAISDYAKGFLTDSLLRKIITLACEKNIPVIVDPKGSDFLKYRGASVIKPNLSEAIIASKLDRKSPLEAVCNKILTEIQIETLLVTRAKEGISIFNRHTGREDFPAHAHEVKDVTGAGDTVLAILAATLANKLDMKIGAYLANVAAGIAIERLGCARITLKEIARRLIEHTHV